LVSDDAPFLILSPPTGEMSSFRYTDIIPAVDTVLSSHNVNEPFAWFDVTSYPVLVYIFNQIALSDHVLHEDSTVKVTRAILCSLRQWATLKVL